MMLSMLQHAFIVDAQQCRTKLYDVVVDMTVGDYPPVTHLIFWADQHYSLLPWSAVQRFIASPAQFVVADLQAAPPLETPVLERLVLLKRDVLDALVVDVQRRRVTRANDLWLEQISGVLHLGAADGSAGAIVRRLSRGWFNGKADLYDWKHVEFVRGMPRMPSTTNDNHRRITRLPPGEIARLLADLPYLHAAEMVRCLPGAVATDAVEAMVPERQLQVVEELPEHQALGMLMGMAPDRAVDLIGRLHPELARHYLNQLPPQRANQLIELLRYSEDTVGGIMTNDVAVVPAHLSVGAVRTIIRDQINTPDFVYFVYVVNDMQTRQLCGVLTLRHVLRADDDTPLETLMQRQLELLSPLEPALLAAQRVVDSQLAALPVVASDGRLLGVVTVDDAVAQMAPLSWRTQAPRVFS